VLKGKRSLYDDFSYSHAVADHSAHRNAYFLPWRAFRPFIPSCSLPEHMLMWPQTAGFSTYLWDMGGQGRREEEGYCIEGATQSDYIHNQMSKQVTNRVT
jgi:hypothetical protein